MVLPESLVPWLSFASSSAVTFMLAGFQPSLHIRDLVGSIDLVTTPDGSLVGMVHANNCTSDINGWAGLFREFAAGLGVQVDPDQLYSTLYTKALEGEDDCGGLLSYGYLSGENLVDVSEGRPMVLRTPESRFTLAN